MTKKFLVLRTDDIESFTHPGELSYHSQHILGSESVGLHDLFLNQGTLDPQSGLGGANHPVNDEIYYIVEGRSLLDLGGHPDTGEGSETLEVEAGMVIYVPAGTFHRLRNVFDERLRILAIWPEPAPKGANPIHDLRLETWGTGLRLRQGCTLVPTEHGTRGVEPDAGWDPLVD